ncbi:MAG: alpha-amylase family glycosyl hydrolase [Pseudomonadota bacterium]
MTDLSNTSDRAPAAAPRLDGLPVTGLTPESSQAPTSDASYRLQELLSHLYGAGAAPMMARRLERIATTHGPAADQAVAAPAAPASVRFSEQDQVLITYGDSVLATGLPPLWALKRFADGHLDGLFSAIHVLPFFPFSSDDGFAVTDYQTVREDLGGWQHIEALSERFELMFDLVINHCSREHLWFADFVGGLLPGCDYFLTSEPSAELDQVVRPRNTPLLSLVQTRQGPKHVWTTFSEDQVDLNFGNPDVLFRFAEILLDYVRHGARYIRLDAIAFLWKRLGSNCSSLPETHMVVKVLRILLELSGVPVRLLTETNVPHAENVSYFGNGDEAHLVYQFSLAPLLLYAYLFEDAAPLGEWLEELDSAPAGCTYLNFIASHDGIGLRPLEGLLPIERVDALVDRCRERGAFVTLRTTADGEERPYEINSSLFSALGDGPQALPAFLAMHQLLLAFAGIPALYVHSLFGTLNDRMGVERTGRTRSINRSQLELGDIEAQLDDPDSRAAQVFSGLREALALRRAQSAFHPEARQTLLRSTRDQLLFERCAETQHILVVASFSQAPASLAWPEGWVDGADCMDLLTGEICDGSEPLAMAPLQVRWLVAH